MVIEVNGVDRAGVFSFHGVYERRCASPNHFSPIVEVNATIVPSTCNHTLIANYLGAPCTPNYFMEPDKENFQQLNKAMR